MREFAARVKHCIIMQSRWRAGPPTAPLLQNGVRLTCSSQCTRVMAGVPLYRLGGFSSLCVLHRQLGCNDEAASVAEAAEQLLYFYPRDGVPLEAQLEHAGFCLGVWEMTKMFEAPPSPAQEPPNLQAPPGVPPGHRARARRPPAAAALSLVLHGKRYVFYEPEPQVLVVLVFVNPHFHPVTTKKNALHSKPAGGTGGNSGGSAPAPVVGYLPAAALAASASAGASKAGPWASCSAGGGLFTGTGAQPSATVSLPLPLSTPGAPAPGAAALTKLLSFSSKAGEAGASTTAGAGAGREGGVTSTVLVPAIANVVHEAEDSEGAVWPPWPRDPLAFPSAHPRGPAPTDPGQWLPSSALVPAGPDASSPGYVRVIPSQVTAVSLPHPLYPPSTVRFGGGGGGVASALGTTLELPAGSDAGALHPAGWAGWDTASVSDALLTTHLAGMWRALTLFYGSVGRVVDAQPTQAYLAAARMLRKAQRKAAQAAAAAAEEAAAAAAAVAREVAASSSGASSSTVATEDDAGEEEEEASTPPPMLATPPVTRSSLFAPSSSALATTSHVLAAGGAEPLQALQAARATAFLAVSPLQALRYTLRAFLDWHIFYTDWARLGDGLTALDGGSTGSGELEGADGDDEGSGNWSDQQALQALAGGDAFALAGLAGVRCVPDLLRLSVLLSKEGADGPAGRTLAAWTPPATLEPFSGTRAGAAAARARLGVSSAGLWAAAAAYQLARELFGGLPHAGRVYIAGSGGGPGGSAAPGAGGGRGEGRTGVASYGGPSIAPSAGGRPLSVSYTTPVVGAGSAGSPGDHILLLFYDGVLVWQQASKRRDAGTSVLRGSQLQAVTDFLRRHAWHLLRKGYAADTRRMALTAPAPDESEAEGDAILAGLAKEAAAVRLPFWQGPPCLCAASSANSAAASGLPTPATGARHKTRLVDAVVPPTPTAACVPTTDRPSFTAGDGSSSGSASRSHPLFELTGGSGTETGSRRGSLSGPVQPPVVTSSLPQLPPVPAQAVGMPGTPWASTDFHQSLKPTPLAAPALPAAAAAKKALRGLVTVESLLPVPSSAALADAEPCSAPGVALPYVSDAYLRALAPLAAAWQAAGEDAGPGDGTSTPDKKAPAAAFAPTSVRGSTAGGASGTSPASSLPPPFHAVGCIGPRFSVASTWQAVPSLADRPGALGPFTPATTLSGLGSTAGGQRGSLRLEAAGPGGRRRSLDASALPSEAARRSSRGGGGEAGAADLLGGDGSVAATAPPRKSSALSRRGSIDSAALTSAVAAAAALPSGGRSRASSLVTPGLPLAGSSGASSAAATGPRKASSSEPFPLGGSDAAPLSTPPVLLPSFTAHVSPLPGSSGVLASQDSATVCSCCGGVRLVDGTGGAAAVAAGAATPGLAPSTASSLAAGSAAGTPAAAPSNATRLFMPPLFLSSPDAPSPSHRLLWAQRGLLSVVALVDAKSLAPATPIGIPAPPVGAGAADGLDPPALEACVVSLYRVLGHYGYAVDVACRAALEEAAMKGAWAEALAPGGSLARGRGASGSGASSGSLGLESGPAGVAAGAGAAGNVGGAAAPVARSLSTLTSTTLDGSGSSRDVTLRPPPSLASSGGWRDLSASAVSLRALEVQRSGGGSGSSASLDEDATTAALNVSDEVVAAFAGLASGGFASVSRKPAEGSAVLLPAQGVAAAAAAAMGERAVDTDSSSAVSDATPVVPPWSTPVSSSTTPAGGAAAWAGREYLGPLPFPVPARPPHYGPFEPVAASQAAPVPSSALDLELPRHMKAASVAGLDALALQGTETAAGEGLKRSDRCSATRGPAPLAPLVASLLAAAAAEAQAEQGLAHVAEGDSDASSDGDEHGVGEDDDAESLDGVVAATLDDAMWGGRGGSSSGSVGKTLALRQRRRRRPATRASGPSSIITADDDRHPSSPPPSCTVTKEVVVLGTRYDGVVVAGRRTEERALRDPATTASLSPGGGPTRVLIAATTATAVVALDAGAGAAAAGSSASEFLTTSRPVVGLVPEGLARWEALTV